MKAIWKWEVERPLSLNRGIVIEMPENTELLCAQEQNGNIAIWGVVETGLRSQKRALWLCGTNQPFEYVGKYLGTVQFSQGRWVIHVFDLGEEHS